MAGNRTLKTTSGAWDLVSVANGYSSIRDKKYPVPNVCWAVALDHADMGLVMRERLEHFLGPIGYGPGQTRFNKQQWIYTLPNGSQIHVKSQEAGRSKFQGAGVIKLWIDEQNKHDDAEEIFQESLARSKPGWEMEVLYTFTPLVASGWHLKRLLDERSPERYPKVKVFQFSLDDLHVSHGGVWTDEDIAREKAKWRPEERDVRIHGKWGGLAGKEFFSVSDVESALTRCETGKRFFLRVAAGHKPILEEHDAGKLTIFRPPASGHRYVVGADTGGGIKRDDSVANVWDRDDRVCVASYRSNTIPPDIFGAQVCVGLGCHYNYALIVPETNGEHGGTMLAALRSKRYPNIFQRTEWDKVTLDYRNEYGWRTTTKTRSRIFDTYKKYLAYPDTIFSRASLEEAQHIVIDDDDRPDHLDGYHDDGVVADGVALIGMEDTAAPKLPPWSYFKRRISTGETGWMEDGTTRAIPRKFPSFA